MAKRKAARRARPGRSSRTAKKTTRSVKRPKSRAVRKAKPGKASRKPAPPRRPKSPARKAAAPARPEARVRAKASPRPAPAQVKAASVRTKTPRLERARRTLGDDGVPTPPSSLDMVRHGTAVRTGRAEIEQGLVEHRGMSESIKGGDVDVDVEDAYFTGDEAPGGDNPTPDQDIVDDIGKALGVQYQDNEELRPNEKVEERDKHRWELDPASSEDYRGRKK